MFPEAVKLMREWRGRGGRIIGASNQGGIALGHCSVDDVLSAAIETQRQAGGLFDVISFCRHHPRASDPEMARCWCRKPAPGLVIEALIPMAREYEEFYPPHMALFVGDREEDRACAAILSMDFMWAADWRGMAK